MAVVGEQYNSTVDTGRNAIETELQSIVDSEFFAGSKRSQEFLRFVVESALRGRGDDLKERTLGVELFGREPAYDTGEDSIVRGKARDVRRRLGQYNAQPKSGQTVRIELPVGSYVPEFHWLAESPNEDAAKPSRLRIRWALLAAALILIAACILAVNFFHSLEEPLDAFWRPVATNANRAMICIGHPVVYLLSRRVHEQFRSRHAEKMLAQPADPKGRASVQIPDQYPLPFAPREILTSDLLPVPDQFVGLGDANAAFRLASTLTSMRQSSVLRAGNDVSFSELRTGPLVLVGAFSNRWTMKITSGLRFEFELEGPLGRKVVADHQNPGRSWAPPSMSPVGKVSEDYAIVSRIFHPEAGQPVVAVAGITQFGTHAAGEFITNAQLFRQAVEHAPKGWERLNMQFVLRTRVIGSVPGPGEVVASHFW